MTNLHASLDSILMDHGQSITKPRQKVFDQLKNQETTSMHDLIVACSETIDRASVYRTVSLFERLGIVQRIHIGMKYRLELTDQFRDHHHHAICTKCGQITTIREDTTLEQLLRKLASENGFLIQSHQVEIRGLCLHCSGHR